jgi:hypothetical protein
MITWSPSGDEQGVKMVVVVDNDGRPFRVGELDGGVVLKHFFFVTDVPDK